MHYDEYICRAYETARRHGFHDEELPLEHLLMLTVTQKAYELCRLLTSGNPSASTISLALAFLTGWARSDGIDIEWHIAQKMEYNDMRSRKHGKMY